MHEELEDRRLRRPIAITGSDVVKGVQIPLERLGVLRRDGQGIQTQLRRYLEARVTGPNGISLINHLGRQWTRTHGDVLVVEHLARVREAFLVKRFPDDLKALGEALT